jgi:hypothetical protein
MRPAALVVAIIPLIAWPLLQSVPARSAQTCFGLPATIADHHGDIDGTAGDDVMIGNDGDNDFISHGGTDRICGGGGDDFVGYQFDAVKIYADGGPGDDWLIGSEAGDELRGGPGADH